MLCFFTVFYFLVFFFFNFQWFDMSVYAFSKWFTKRTGLVLHMCECGCVCVIYVYVCVARYQWCGLFCVVFCLLHFFKLFTMLYLRCTSPVFGWVSFLCVFSWCFAVAGLVVVVMVINAGLNCMLFCFLLFLLSYVFLFWSLI